MLLSHKTSIKVNQDYANIIGHMCYAAYKLWNICNYERYHYKELGIENYPDWYYQKKVHKEDLWFKQLPSQSAQEVCKQLDKAWRSFFTLKRTGGIENPRPPRFKQEGISIVYMQNAVVHEKKTAGCVCPCRNSLRSIWKKDMGSMPVFYILKMPFSGTWTISNRSVSPRHRMVSVRLS